MFWSFSALSTALSGALDRCTRVFERAKPFGEGEREKERERWTGERKRKRERKEKEDQEIR